MCLGMVLTMFNDVGDFIITKSQDIQGGLNWNLKFTSLKWFSFILNIRTQFVNIGSCTFEKKKKKEKKNESFLDFS